MNKSILTPLHTNKKAFASLYFLLLLEIVVTNCLSVTQLINEYLHYRNVIETNSLINNVEILCINRIKTRFEKYSEKDETLIYDGCIIHICISHLQGDLIIEYKGVTRERHFEYNDEEMVFSIYK